AGRGRASLARCASDHSPRSWRRASASASRRSRREPPGPCSRSRPAGAAVGLLTSGLVIGAIAIPVTGRVASALAAEDPGCIVLDEIAGQLIASSVVPLVASPSPRLAPVPWIASFLAFRLFDVWKPGPIRGWQRLPGGLGIVVDDAAAGVLAA